MGSCSSSKIKKDLILGVDIIIDALKIIEKDGTVDDQDVKLNNVDLVKE
jgi:hypothetical protein